MSFRKWLRSEEHLNEKYGESLTRRSQIEWLRNESGNQIVDYIGRVETIADDFRLIADRHVRGMNQHTRQHRNR